LLIGGATTSKIHTAVKISPNYQGPVVHVKDASVNTAIVSKLMNANTIEEFTREVAMEYRELREKQTKKSNLLSLEEARSKRPQLF